METNTPNLLNISDIELTNQIKENNDEDALKELISRHSGICTNIYKKFEPVLTASGIAPNDILDQKDYIVYKSAISFKPEKNVKVVTWIGNRMKFLILSKLTEKKKDFLTSTEDSTLEYLLSQNPTEQLNHDNFFTILSEIEDKRIYDIFMFRYFDSPRQKWKDISKAMGLSIPSLTKLHKKGLKILKSKLKKQENTI